jgi:hypothetical protein
VDELGQPNHGGTWERESLGADHFILIRFDDLRFSIDHETKRPSHRDHGEGLERRVQSQTPNDHADYLPWNRAFPSLPRAALELNATHTRLSIALNLTSGARDPSSLTRRPAA